MATHSSTLAWKIPWMEEPDRLQSMGSLRVGHDWATSLSIFPFMHWRRKWQPTPVFLPGESQGRGSLVGCHLWGHTVGHGWRDLAAAAAGTIHFFFLYPQNLVPITLIWCGDKDQIFSNIFIDTLLFNYSYELSNVDIYSTHLWVLYVIFYYRAYHFIHSHLIVHFLCLYFSQGSGPEHEHIFCTLVDMKLLGHKNFKFHHRWLFLFYASTLHL